MQHFKQQLNDEIRNSLKNNYTDNVDYIRFPEKTKSKQPFRTVVSSFLRFHFPQLMNLIKPIKIISFEDSLNIEKKITLLEFKGLNFLFEKLEDELSKKLLIKLIAYRVLGHKKVKLPLSNKQYWKKFKEIDSKVDKNDFIDPKFLNFKLYKHYLKNYNLGLYFTSKGILTDFELEQYAYKNGEFLISVKEGDVVIDAGGCWGDTALYFAMKVGKKGKVYSFEFIPSNIEIFTKNLSLNPEINKGIELIEKPVWEQSNLEMFYVDKGPGSKVSFDKIGEVDIKVSTKSIDDFVAENNIQRINFIKMDIEGAEPYALKGAINTINAFKPVLAIAIYHSKEDFINIPNWIDSLNLGYKFYLGHYSIHDEETILFAEI